MALLALLACTDPGKPAAPDTGDEDTGVPYVPVCPKVAPPELDAQVWTQAGPLPGTGMHSVSSDGSAPIWIASHSTGIWRADDDLAWDDVVLGITHTVSEIALRPGEPEHFFRSAGGTAERTRDGGETWTRLSLGELTGGPVDEVRALAVTPWAPDRVLGLQRSGAASISEDDGDTWITAGYAPIHEPPIVDDPFYVWGWRLLPEPEEGGRVVFGDGFGIAVSDDAMGTWTRTLDTELGGYSLIRSPTDPAHLFVGSPDGLYESTDEGETWTLRDIGDGVGGAWANDGSWLAIVGSADIFVSEDDGATFVARTHPMPMPGGAVILDDGRLVVADHMGAWMSPDRGETWVEISDGLEDRGVSVVATDPHCPARVIAGSRCGGGLFTSQDYGETWAPVHTYFHYVMGVEFVPGVADALYGVSDDRLLYSDDAGHSWREVFQRFHFHGFALHPDEPDTLLLGSVGGGEWADTAMSVYRSTDGGATWEDSSEGLPDDASSAHTLIRWPGAPDTVLLGTYKAGDVSHRTGQGTGLYRSADGGQSWAHVEVDVVDIAALAWGGGEAVHAATDDGVWRSTDEGVTWTQALGGVGSVIAVRFGDAGTPAASVGLALTGVGDLYKSVDAGETWEQWDTALASNPTTTLAQIALSADGTVGFVTVFDEGVWRIAL